MIHVIPMLRLLPIFCFTFDGHEALQDALRTEHAETPTEDRKHVHGQWRFAFMFGEGVPEVGVFDVASRERFVGDEKQREGQDQETRENEDGLKHVGARYGEEAADEGVGSYCYQRDDHSSFVVQTEDGVQQFCTGYQSRTDVEDDEQNCDQGGDGSQGAGAIAESTLEELWCGERIFGGDGEATETLCHEYPRETHHGTTIDTMIHMVSSPCRNARCR